MIFLQVFIRSGIYTQFGGLSEQHQGNSRKNSRKIFHVFAGKTSTFVSADTTKWREQNCLCGKQIRITENFFG